MSAIYRFLCCFTTARKDRNQPKSSFFLFTNEACSKGVNSSLIMVPHTGVDWCEALRRVGRLKQSDMWGEKLWTAKTERSWEQQFFFNLWVSAEAPPSPLFSCSVLLFAPVTYLSNPFLTLVHITPPCALLSLLSLCPPLPRNPPLSLQEAVVNQEHLPQSLWSSLCLRSLAEAGVGRRRRAADGGSAVNHCH